MDKDNSSICNVCHLCTSYASNICTEEFSKQCSLHSVLDKAVMIALNEGITKNPSLIRDCPMNKVCHGCDHHKIEHTKCNLFRDVVYNVDVIAEEKNKKHKSMYLRVIDYISRAGKIILGRDYIKNVSHNSSDLSVNSKLIHDIVDKYKEVDKSRSTWRLIAIGSLLTIAVILIKLYIIR